MKRAAIGENKAYFENNYGVKFICWKYSGSHWCICFDGFSKGRNFCPYVKGGEDLLSVSDCYSLAETIKTEA